MPGYILSTLSDSLKDQLLKAGFKETKSAPKAKAPKAKNSGKHSASKGAAGKKSNHRSGRNTFSEKKATSAAKQSSTKDPSSAQQEAAASAEKKRVKAAIKELIEASALKDFKGETAYSFVLGNKVRQLFVNADAHKKLSDGEWVITRLNGNTQLIPLEQVQPILALNPDWAIVQNQADGDKSADDDYKDYQIPDDLTW